MACHFLEHSSSSSNGAEELARILVEKYDLKPKKRNYLEDIEVTTWRTYSFKKQDRVEKADFLINLDTLCRQKKLVMGGRSQDDISITSCDDDVCNSDQSVGSTLSLTSISSISDSITNLSDFDDNLHHYCGNEEIIDINEEIATDYRDNCRSNEHSYCPALSIDLRINTGWSESRLVKSRNTSASTGKKSIIKREHKYEGKEGSFVIDSDIKGLHTLETKMRTLTCEQSVSKGKEFDGVNRDIFTQRDLYEKYVTSNRFGTLTGKNPIDRVDPLNTLFDGIYVGSH